MRKLHSGKKMGLLESLTPAIRRRPADFEFSKISGITRHSGAEAAAVLPDVNALRHRRRG